jgi:hypothetical protein
MSLLQKLFNSQEAPADRFLPLGEVKGMQLAPCLCLLTNEQLSIIILQCEIYFSLDFMSSALLP